MGKPLALEKPLSYICIFFCDLTTFSLTLGALYFPRMPKIQNQKGSESLLKIDSEKAENEYISRQVINLMKKKVITLVCSSM